MEQINAQIDAIHALMARTVRLPEKIVLSEASTWQDIQRKRITDDCAERLMNMARQARLQGQPTSPEFDAWATEYFKQGIES